MVLLLYHSFHLLLPFCTVCSGAAVVTLLQFPPNFFPTDCSSSPSISDFFTNPRFLFSPSTLFPWLFYPSFFFHLPTSVFLILQLQGGKRNIDCTVALALLPPLFSLLSTCGLLVMHIDFQPKCTLLLMYMQFFTRSHSLMAPNLVEGRALWHNQQTSYKVLLLAAFSGKAQIVQVAPVFMGFWFWGTFKTLPKGITC